MDQVFFTPPIKIKRLRQAAVIPTAAKAGDACLDLVFAPDDEDDVTLHPGDTRTLETGLAIELPTGWEALVRSRSGLAAGRSVMVLNSPGTIDSGYRGEIKVILHNAGREPMKFAPGTRIAQICFKLVYVPRLQEVDELGDSARGTAGLGSTGV